MSTSGGPTLPSPGGTRDPGGTGISPGAHTPPDPTHKDGRCRIPRPPVPGEEIGVQWDPRPSDVRWDSQCQPLLQQDHYFHDEGGGDGPAMVGSVEGGSPCSGGEDTSTPPHIQWTKSLNHLLEDVSGVKLFTKFLMEEVGSVAELQFLFACKGLRNFDPNVDKLVPSIFKRFLQKDTSMKGSEQSTSSNTAASKVTSPTKSLPPTVHPKVKLSSETYSAIKKRIESKEFSSDIFEVAQHEVEEKIATTTYPSFLKSELYLSYHNQQGSDSPPSIGHVGSGFLEPVPEDLEMPSQCGHMDMSAHQHIRLTQGALAATVQQRLVGEPRQPEATAGRYLSNGTHTVGLSPYHATYHSGHMVSRQDSLQSISSGALTDDTLSRSNSSVDRLSMGFDRPMSKRHQKKQHHRMLENIRMNQEQAALEGRSPLSYINPIPRSSTINKSKLEAPNPSEFAATLIDKLEQYQRSQEQHEKITSSFKKIQESEDSAEYRRQLAIESLPPQLLLDKLAQKFPPKDDLDQSQAILDDHVSRVWKDSNQSSPACTPGSPKPAPKSPPSHRGGGAASKALPHLLPYVPTSSSSGVAPSMPPSPHYFNKEGMLVRGAAYPSMYPSVAYLPPGTQYGGAAPVGMPYQPGMRHPGMPHAYPLHPYQANKSWHHGRRKDRGPDATSTFSSDSGNVADYYELGDRVPPTHPIYLPKSRSVPEYMENYAAVNSDGGSSGRRQGSSSRRSNSRRPPADLTDSGVSVVSDSGQSLVPSASSTERVETWLQHTTKYSPGGTTTCSMSPQVMYVEEKEGAKSMKGSRSTHTAAGSTSPGTVRRSSSRRCSGAGAVPGAVGIGRSVSLERGALNPGGGPPCAAAPCHHHHHYHTTVECTGQPQHLPPHGDDRRRWRVSGRSTHTDAGSGSNGSTLKKQHRSSRHSNSGPSNSDSTGGGGGGSSSSNSNSGSCRGASTTPTASGAVVTSATTSSTSSTTGSHPPECTNVVYNYHDEHVPFSIRIPTRSVTLKKFKHHLPKKGNYRFFFKKHCEEFGVIQEEITDDLEVLPLYEGRIFAQIRKAD